MQDRIGSGFFGSDSIKTSTANQEILQAHKPSDYPFGKLMVYKFSFYNDQACHIKINESSNQVYLRAGQGFEMNHIDAYIFSFVIVESGITYNYVGAH